MKDTYHWCLSSAQPSACTVEPGDARDLGKIVSLVIILVRFRVLIVVIDIVANPWKIPYSLRRQ